MITAYDKLEEIYNTIIEHQGCVNLIVKNPWTQEYDNLCAQAGYAGNPADIVVCNDKWASVVRLLVFPDTCLREFIDQFNSDKTFREQYLNDPQGTKIKWIKEHKDFLFNKCLNILGLTESQAKATPYEVTCNSDTHSTKPNHESNESKEHKQESHEEQHEKQSNKQKPEKAHEKTKSSSSKSSSNDNNDTKEGKHPLKSKTIWFSIALLIASILTHYFHIKVSPDQIMEVIAVIIAILRMLTKEPLKV